jgi:uncharacterized protein (TIGR03435 family)
MKVSSHLLFVLALTAGSASAQQALEFDVATFKLSPAVPPGTPLPINLGTFQNGMLTLTNVTLSECIQFAYGLYSDDQIAGPEWARSREVRFDMVAKTATDTPRDRVLLMFQSLLAERLKVAVHYEQRPMSFLALVVARNGPKLITAREGQGQAIPNTVVRGRIVASQMPMHVLATLLSRFERQLIVDKTALPGRYELKLEWTPIDGAAAPFDPTAPPSIFTALQEQLGLRLESRKEPLDILVIDRAEKAPTDN